MSKHDQLCTLCPHFIAKHASDNGFCMAEDAHGKCSCSCTGGDACPGASGCHGCLAFCVHCGDVALVCDDPECDTHPRPEDLEHAIGSRYSTRGRNDTLVAQRDHAEARRKLYAAEVEQLDALIAKYTAEAQRRRAHGHLVSRRGPPKPIKVDL